MPADGFETPHSNQAGVQKQATHCEFVSSTRSALLPFGASPFLFLRSFLRPGSRALHRLWTPLFGRFFFGWRGSLFGWHVLLGSRTMPGAPARAFVLTATRVTSAQLNQGLQFTSCFPWLVFQMSHSFEAWGNLGSPWSSLGANLAAPILQEVSSPKAVGHQAALQRMPNAHFHDRRAPTLRYLRGYFLVRGPVLSSRNSHLGTKDLPSARSPYFSPVFLGLSITLSSQCPFSFSSVSGDIWEFLRAGELIGQALLKSEAELEALENLEVIEPSAAETEAEVRHLSRHPVVGLVVGIGFGGCGTFGIL